MHNDQAVVLQFCMITHHQWYAMEMYNYIIVITNEPIFYTKANRTIEIEIETTIFVLIKMLETLK